MDIITSYEIAGLVVTFATTVFTYLKSQAEAKKLNTLFVSTLGVIFTMLFSLRFGVLPRIEEHLVLAEKLNRSPRVISYLEGLSKAAGLAEASENSVMGYVLNIRLRALERDLGKLDSGRFIVDVSDIPDVAIELITGAKNFYRATSYINTSAWWDTPWGRKYEQLNYEAVKRGVRITRTFIFSNKAEMDNARSHLDRQVKNGITIKIAMASDLGAEVTSDMVVVDENLAGELLLTPDKGMKQAEFFTQQTDIEEVRRRIARLEAQAEDYVGSP